MDVDAAAQAEAVGERVRVADVRGADRQDRDLLGGEPRGQQGDQDVPAGSRVR